MMRKYWSIPLLTKSNKWKARVIIVNKKQLKRKTQGSTLKGNANVKNGKAFTPTKVNNL